MYIYELYKYKKELPKRNGTIIKFNLTTQQCAWLVKRREEGVPVFVSLGIGKSIVFTQNFENVNNLTKSEFIDKAMSIDDFVGKLEEICVK